jgi:hypothetical protein
LFFGANFNRFDMRTPIQSAEILDLLNDILRILCRGLPQYLIEAKPWLQSSDAPFLASLRNLIADQRHYANRVAEAAAHRGGRPDPGSFPLEYAPINDLSLDFLKNRILEQLHNDYTALSQIVKLLSDQHELHALAEEIAGNYRGHLEELEGTEKSKG